jgi:hypothetical protein
MEFIEIAWSDMDWTGLAQDRDQWRTLVNKVFFDLVWELSDSIS